MKKLEVVAAIFIKNHKVFATQRGYGEFKDYWEFPGGKIEKGETPEQALVREIKEELNVLIRVGDCIEEIEYAYPSFLLHLRCYQAFIEEGEMTLVEHEDATWITKDKIEELSWLPADKDIILKIKNLL